MENKYLEKIAALFNIGRGFAGLGAWFRAADSAVGSLQRTVARAAQKTTPSPFAIRGAIRRDAEALPSSGSRRDAIKQIVQTMRQQKGLVKNPQLEVRDTGNNAFIKKINNGYKANTATEAGNKFLKNVNQAGVSNDLRVQKIHAARAKLGLAGADLAGAAGLGYHMGHKNAENQPQQFYMP